MKRPYGDLIEWLINPEIQTSVRGLNHDSRACADVARDDGSA